MKIAPSSAALANVLVTESWSVPLILIAKSASPAVDFAASIDITTIT
jgi:hypothetical protein